MLDTVVLTLSDDVRILVPDTLDSITPYVLREQLDFFEDELPFVRRLLQPGENVIDIGANYGVYTLPMAKRVGPTGEVWAFEPASSTAQFLAQSIAMNEFTQVRLERKAVSSEPGSAQLSLHVHPELRSIVHGEPPPEGSETVTLVTLDDCMDRFGWRDIALIKIDAEGEEANIVRGGRRFFANLAPLVQYELRTSATTMNVALISDFASMGYDSYRLLPGLNILVPYDAESAADGYVLNLFCCNPARAERLSARGLLLRSNDLTAASARSGIGTRFGAKHHWRHTLAPLAYAMPLVSTWDAADTDSNFGELQAGLSSFACSRDVELTLAERFRALESSFLQFKALCMRAPSRLRLASFARVAHDYGQRAVVVDALSQLVEAIRLAGFLDPKEPFLTPLERFEAIGPGDALGSWIIAAVLEQLELRQRFSSFYAGAGGLERLEAIEALGFGSPEMERRLRLVRLCIERARIRSEQRPVPRVTP